MFNRDWSSDVCSSDLVAMTGGQPVDGTLKVPEMTRELDAEGAVKIGRASCRERV